MVPVTTSSGKLLLLGRSKEELSNSMSHDKLLNVTTAWKSSLVRQFLAADILIRYRIAKKKTKNDKNTMESTDNIIVLL